MASKKKLTDLDEIVEIADGDVLHIVDVSDTEQDPAGSSKKISIAQLKEEISQGASAVASVNGQTGVVVLDTDDIDEGTENLYMTGARFDSMFTAKSTDDLDEGSTNLYYTTSRANADFDSRFTTKSTSDLAEGTNLYYTDTRFDDRFATKTSDNVSEGSSNLYFTATRVRDTVLTGLDVSGGTIIATDTVLGAFGKIQNQINAVIGGVSYQGAWDADANNPSLSSSVGVKGNYYVVSVPGATNLDGITDWKLGDWAIFNGSAWEKVDNTDAVISVNGFTGAVILSTADIAEDTNLYFTDARAVSALTGEDISIFNNNSGYLTSYTETDPVFGAWATAHDNHANWDTAYGWGNHASAGYATTSALSAYVAKAGDTMTGNLTISKANPIFTVTDDGATSGNASSAYFEKLATGDGAQISSQNRLWSVANGLGVYGATKAAHNVTFSGAFSVSLWCKPNSSGQNMFMGGDNSNLYNWDSGYFGFRPNTFAQRTWAYSLGNWQNGNWHHVVLTVSANKLNVNLYVDGTLLSIYSAGTMGGDFINQYILGSWLGGFSQGEFDEFLIYTKELSGAEVTALYNGGNPIQITSYTNVYAAWHMNSSSGTALLDGSGNGRNLTLSGGSPTWQAGKVTTGINPLTKIPFGKIVNNTTPNSYGTLTHGYYDSSVLGTSNIYEGLSHQFNILGSSKMTMTASGVNISAYTGNLAVGSALSAGTTITAGTQLITANGSVSAPGLTSSADPNTGPYWGGADTFFIATGGGTRTSWDASGHTAQGTTTSSAIFARFQKSATQFTVGTTVVQGEGTHTQNADNAFGFVGMTANVGLTTAGFNNTVALGSGGGLSGFYGLVQVSSTPATGTVSAIIGARMSVRNNGAGIVSDAIGYYVMPVQNTGAGSIDKAYGFRTANFAAGTTGNYGFYGEIASASNKWNLYMAGTAVNYMKGALGMNVDTPTALVDVNSDIIRVRTAKTPSSASATGNQGDICWDADYIYVAVASNTWKRGALSTW